MTEPRPEGTRTAYDFTVEGSVTYTLPPPDPNFKWDESKYSMRSLGNGTFVFVPLTRWQRFKRWLQWQ
jgi:hypothetical protein